MKHIALLLILSAVTGCGLKSAGMVPPSDDKIWSKAGDSNVAVKKAIMECGMPNPFHDVYSTKRMTLNEGVIYRFCMERTGYHTSTRSSGTQYCKTLREHNLPACQPGAIIPTPSARKRLNSSYCKSSYYKIQPECQP